MPQLWKINGRLWHPVPPPLWATPLKLPQPLSLYCNASIKLRPCRYHVSAAFVRRGKFPKLFYAKNFFWVNFFFSQLLFYCSFQTVTVIMSRCD